LGVKEEALIKAVLAALTKKFPNLVAEIRFALGTDKDGQEAVFVTVILKDKKNGDYQWAEVQPVEQAIRREVTDKDPFRFPYVGFQLQSELPQAAG
jgi:hypothetical protein